MANVRRTYGTSSMHRRLVATLRWMHPWFVYALCGAFIAPWCAAFKSSGRVVYGVYRRRFGFGRFKALRHVWLNHYRFAQTVVDRFAMYAGRRFRLKVEGMEHFERLAAEEGGFVMLSSHIGCYEMAGYMLRSEHKQMYVVVYGGEKESVMAGREGRLTPNRIEMIPTAPDGISHLFAINNALADGQIVSLPADRVVGSQKTLRISILDAEADIPLGPFATIATRRCPVLAVNVMREPRRRYRAFVTPIPYDDAAPAAKLRADVAAGYAAEITRLMRRYPEQWFNFHPFWREDAAAAAAPDAVAASDAAAAARAGASGASGAAAAARAVASSASGAAHGDGQSDK